MKRMIFSFSVLMVSILTVHAQMAGKGPRSNVPEDPFAWATYTYDAPANFKDKLDGEEVEVSEHEIDLFGTVPLIWNDPVLLLGGVQLKWNGFYFDNLSDEDQNVYTIAFPVDLLYEGVYPWQLYAGLSPGFYTDFEQMDGDDFKMLGYAFGSYPVQENLQLAAGVQYDQVFGKDRFYPVGGAIWNPAPEWEVQLFFPTPRVQYAPQPGFLAFVDAQPAGGNWSVFEDDREYNFKVESIRFSGGIQYALTERTWLLAAVGLNTARNLEIEQADDRVFDGDVEDTVFARVGILVR